MHPPQTPPVSNPRDTDPDVDLDLSSLGLHDREIPPDKITKLSKIGSGGFKDVFVGKLKTRRVAIAEFRGQLNSSEYSIKLIVVIVLLMVLFNSGYQRTQTSWRLQSS